MKRFKIIFLFLFLLIISTQLLNAQVGINEDNSDPHASAMLHIKSNSKGLLIPRLTTAQRTAILSPANGLMTYDIDTNSFWYYNGTVWQEITLNTDDQTLTLTGTTLGIEDGNTIDLATIDTDTDDQTLTLTGTSLSIADGNAVDLASIDTDTDDQTLTLTGTSLSIADGNAVDLASIDTDTDTDDQTIDVLSLTGSTLEISLVDDGEATKTLDLSSIDTDTDTDDQTLSLTGTSLSIADGNSVDLASIDTDTDTDDQTIDVLSLTGSTLEISLADDGEATKTLDLSSIDTDTDTDDQTLSLVGTSLSIADGNSVDLASIDTDTDTDDQTIDVLSLTGSTLEISLADDGEATKTLDLSSIDTDTDTDDQTLSLSGTTISIADGNSIDLAGLNTDNDWTESGSDMYNANSGNVGIGTSSPNATAKLHVDLGGSTTDGILVSGTYDGASTIPDLGCW